MTDFAAFRRTRSRLDPAGR